MSSPSLPPTYLVLLCHKRQALPVLGTPPHHGQQGSGSPRPAACRLPPGWAAWTGLLPCTFARPKKGPPAPEERGALKTTNQARTQLSAEAGCGACSVQTSPACWASCCSCCSWASWLVEPWGAMAWQEAEST